MQLHFQYEVLNAMNNCRHAFSENKWSLDCPLFLRHIRFGILAVVPRQVAEIPPDLRTILRQVLLGRRLDGYDSVFTRLDVFLNV